MRFRFQLLPVFLLTMACSSPEKATDTSAETAVLSDSTEVLAIGDLGSEQFLQEVLGTKLMVRGFNFGDSMEKIRQNETLELFEERPTHLGYVYERPNLESADVLYLRNPKDKLNGVDIDIYLNSPESADAVFNTAKSHYNGFYKKSPSDSLMWLIEPKGNIKINLVKTSLDNGLEIRYRE